MVQGDNSSLGSANDSYSFSYSESNTNTFHEDRDEIATWPQDWDPAEDFADEADQVVVETLVNQPAESYFESLLPELDRILAAGSYTNGRGRRSSLIDCNEGRRAFARKSLDPEDRSVSPRGQIGASGNTAEVSLDVGSPAFDPETYLAFVHRRTTFQSLLQGLEMVREKIQEGDNVVRVAVEENFGRFLSAKKHLDTYYKEFREQGMTTEPSAFPAQLERSHKELCDLVDKVFLPILERHTRLEASRSTTDTIKRYRSVLELPMMMRKALVSEEWAQLIIHFEKAQSILCNSQHPIWVKVWEKVHKLAIQGRDELLSRLESPNVRPETIERYVQYLKALGTKDDPIRMCLRRHMSTVVTVLHKMHSDFVERQGNAQALKKTRRKSVMVQSGESDMSFDDASAKVIDTLHRTQASPSGSPFGTPAASPNISRRASVRAADPRQACEFISSMASELRVRSVAFRQLFDVLSTLRMGNPFEEQQNQVERETELVNVATTLCGNFSKEVSALPLTSPAIVQALSEIYLCIDCMLDSGISDASCQELKDFAEQIASSSLDRSMDAIQLNLNFHITKLSDNWQSNDDGGVDDTTSLANLVSRECCELMVGCSRIVTTDLSQLAGMVWSSVTQTLFKTLDTLSHVLFQSSKSDPHKPAAGQQFLAGTMFFEGIPRSVVQGWQQCSALLLWGIPHLQTKARATFLRTIEQQAGEIPQFSATKVEKSCEQLSSIFLTVGSQAAVSELYSAVEHGIHSPFTPQSSGPPSSAVNTGLELQHVEARDWVFQCLNVLVIAIDSTASMPLDAQCQILKQCVQSLWQLLFFKATTVCDCEDVLLLTLRVEFEVLANALKSLESPEGQRAREETIAFIRSLVPENSNAAKIVKSGLRDALYRGKVMISALQVH